MAPIIPPIPTTELTACLGNISDAVVNMFVAHAWCSATAKLIKRTAAHTLVTNWVAMIDSSRTAIINRAVFRAVRVFHPRLIREDEKYPPVMLPTVVAV